MKINVYMFWACRILNASHHEGMTVNFCCLTRLSVNWTEGTLNLTILVHTPQKMLVLTELADFPYCCVCQCSGLSSTTLASPCTVRLSGAQYKSSRKSWTSTSLVLWGSPKVSSPCSDSQRDASSMLQVLLVNFSVVLPSQVFRSHSITALSCLFQLWFHFF